MSGKGRHSPQELFDIGVDGYLQELRALVGIIGSDSCAELLPLFRNYSDFLQYNLDRCFPHDLMLDLVNEDNVIHVKNLPDAGQRLFNCASLAAGCEVFHGWTIDVGTLTAENCAEVLRENIQIGDVPQPRLGEIMGIRLNRSDALRTAQINKLLGLLPGDTTQYDQLALGASMGERDREGFHRIPGIGPERPGASFSSSSRLNFAVKSCEPKSLVIIDNDKNLAQDFEHINRTESPTIQALNLDLYEGLDHLVAAVERGDCSPRNLVTMFRLEPTALPDVPVFLDKLSRVVDRSAFFLATIGAGDSNAEFVARQNSMDELTAQLKARGLHPLRIILYDQEGQNNEQINIAFCVSAYASFEILFCNLRSADDKHLEGQRKDSSSGQLNSGLHPELWNSFLPTNRMEMAQKVLEFLKKQGRLSEQTQEVLNLGSGVGETSACLEKLHPSFTITDIDQIPYKHELMHQRYVQNDITSLPFRHNSYDVLFSSYAFSYLGNRKEVMSEWLRVLKPGGSAYFIFHAPHSAYLHTAKEMLSADMAKDFFQLIRSFSGHGFTGLYDWFCRKNFAWGKAFTQERQFLSYAHEIQVCKHLVENVASLMFSADNEIYTFFESLGATDISVNVLNRNFSVLPSHISSTESIVAWFVALDKPNV